MRKTTIFARTRADGTVVEVLGDGTERPFPKAHMRPMTDAEIAAAAAADPDARPMTDAALGLTQDEFAERFQIPIGTLRDWEQGRVEPDQAAQAYLRAIAGDAAAVQHALEAGPRRQ